MSEKVYIVVEDASAVVAPNAGHNDAEENSVIPPVAGQNAQNAIIPLVAAANHYLTAMPTFAEPPHDMDMELHVATFSDEINEYGLDLVTLQHEWEGFPAVHLQMPFNAVDDAPMAFVPFGGPMETQIDLEGVASNSEDEDASSNAAQSDESEEMEVEQMLE